ncbi:MAG: 50S ribosomal protein L6 [Clostridiales bacterium]|nr:50S ribosomal protein L6 [Clostridiales bacterium]
MSRVGRKAIDVPEGVNVSIRTDKIEFESAKGKLESPLFPGIQAELVNRKLVFSRADDSKEMRAIHGLARSLAQNAVAGLASGFCKQLEIVGVGYRAKLDKDTLELSLGYSKPILYKIPPGIQVVVEKPTLITVKGIDKQKVGQVAEEIKRYRRPDPYKLKGIRYVGERLIKKERKAGVTGA